MTLLPLMNFPSNTLRWVACLRSGAGISEPHTLMARMRLDGQS